MNPKHVLDYIDYRLPIIQNRHDYNKAIYDKYKANYDAKWYHKMFGMKYTGMWDFWDWFYFDRRITELETMRKEALYKTKMGYTRMDILETWTDDFYKWAEENNIPF